MLLVRWFAPTPAKKSSSPTPVEMRHRNVKSVMEIVQKVGSLLLSLWVASIFVASFPRVHLRLIAQSIMWQRLSACRPVLEVQLCTEM